MCVVTWPPSEFDDSMISLVGLTCWSRGRAQLCKGGSTLDFSPLLMVGAKLRSGVATHFQPEELRSVDLNDVLDARALHQLGGEEVIRAVSDISNRSEVSLRVYNTDRAVGTLLSHHVTRIHGLNGWPSTRAPLSLLLTGSAGQSLGAFLAKGVHITLTGDCCDYLGKGLSGGQIVVRPAKDAAFNQPTHSGNLGSDADSSSAGVSAQDDQCHRHVIAGNVCFYGATSGSAYLRGRALQRFAVRNSGARLVVEGVGDHAAEYMTNGVLVVLGSIGRNFGAGMSGGAAFLLHDHEDDRKTPSNTASLDATTERGTLFRTGQINLAGADLEPVTDSDDLATLYELLVNHAQLTGSMRAQALVRTWPASASRFTKVAPKEFAAVLAAQRKAKGERTAVVEKTPMLLATLENSGMLVQDRATPSPLSRETPQEDTKLESGTRPVNSPALGDRSRKGNPDDEPDSSISSASSTPPLVLQPSPSSSPINSVHSIVSEAAAGASSVSTLDQSPAATTGKGCGSCSCSKSTPCNSIAAAASTRSINPTAGSSASATTVQVSPMVLRVRSQSLADSLQRPRGGAADVEDLVKEHKTALCTALGGKVRPRSIQAAEQLGGANGKAATVPVPAAVPRLCRERGPSSPMNAELYTIALL